MTEAAESFLEPDQLEGIPPGLLLQFSLDVCERFSPYALWRHREPLRAAISEARTHLAEPVEDSFFNLYDTAYTLFHRISHDPARRGERMAEATACALCDVARALKYGPKKVNRGVAGVLWSAMLAVYPHRQPMEQRWCARQLAKRGLDVELTSDQADSAARLIRDGLSAISAVDLVVSTAVA